MNFTDKPRPRWLRYHVAAALFDPPVPTSTLAWWVHTGRLTGHKLGRHVYIDREEIDRLMSGATK